MERKNAEQNHCLSNKENHLAFYKKAQVVLPLSALTTCAETFASFSRLTWYFFYKLTHTGPQTFTLPTQQNTNETLPFFRALSATWENALTHTMKKKFLTIGRILR